MHDTISVTRMVENSKSKCYINGKVETMEKIKNLFCQVKLNVNNPHFLIMQGRVLKVTNMKPSEILGLIEEAAGISLYKQKKEQTENLIQKKENKLIDIEELLKRDVYPQLQKLQTDRENFKQYRINEEELENVKKILIAYEYFEMLRQVNNVGEQQSLMNSRENELSTEISVKQEKVEKLKL